MFDLRYHVASLAAVFLALADRHPRRRRASRGKVGRRRRSEPAERADQPARGRARRRRSERAGDRAASRRRPRRFVEDAYPALIADRLAGKRVAVVFVGPVDAGVRQHVERARRRRRRRQRRSACARSRCRSTPDADRRALATATSPGTAATAARRPRPRARPRARRRRRDAALGRARAVLVEERAGSFREPGDGVVVARTVEAAAAARRRCFLAGLLRGAAPTVGVPAVGVERRASSAPRSPTWSAGRPLDRRRRRRAARAGSRSRCCSPAARPGTTASRRPPTTGSSRRSTRSPTTEWLSPPRSSSPPATRRARSARRSRRSSEQFPGAEVVVADDGSRDATAAEAERAGAAVARLPRRARARR